MYGASSFRSSRILQSFRRLPSVPVLASQVSRTSRNSYFRRLICVSHPPCSPNKRLMESWPHRAFNKLLSSKAYEIKTLDFRASRNNVPNGLVRSRHRYYEDSNVHLRAFSRLYAYAYGSTFQSGSGMRFARFDWFHCYRASWGRLLTGPKSSMPRLFRAEAFAKAVSLACTRSHLPLGIAAIAFGGHRVAHAQGHANIVPSSPASSALLSMYTIFDLCGLITRFFYLCVLFMPAVLTAPFASMLGSYFWQAWLRLVHHSLEFAGAAFIKWGQWAATRPDLFPKDLCLELQKLHSNAPAHKFSYTVRTIERAFGKAIDDIFLDFEEKPVASGSIAQVYKATLKDGVAFSKQKGPMTVAVKVRHPGVSEVIRRDFVIINCIANLSTLIPGLRWLRLDETVHQFAVFMLTQVDLAREAAHLSRFSYNFRTWRDVSFPRPVYPLVHPAVLVESFEQGESVSSYMDVADNIRVNRKLADIGTNTILKMLLVDNFIHADMHPGNILVRVKKGTDKEKRRTRTRPQLVFLDVGLTAELAQKDRINLLEFFKSVALRDGRTAAQCVLDFSNKQSCPNPDAFIKQLETSFTFWGSRKASSIHPEECMQDVLEQVRRHRVNIDGDVCTVIVSIIVLEGWQRKLDPDFNMMRTLQKLLLKRDMAESLAYTINAVMAP